MTLRLNGTTGYVELEAPATAGSNTLVLPTGNGSNGQYLQTSGASGVLSWATLPASGLTWGSSEVSFSGAGQLWTGIPSDAKQIVIAYQNWGNTNNPSSHILEIGDSGGLETSGYMNVQCYSGTSSSGSTNSGNTSWGMSAFTDPVYKHDGIICLTLIETSSNTWGCQWSASVEGTSNGHFWLVGGYKSLSGTLDRVQVRPGSGNFSTGKANLLYLT